MLAGRGWLSRPLSPQTARVSALQSIPAGFLYMSANTHTHRHRQTDRQTDTYTPHSALPQQQYNRYSNIICDKRLDTLPYKTHYSQKNTLSPYCCQQKKHIRHTCDLCTTSEISDKISRFTHPHTLGCHRLLARLLDCPPPLSCQRSRRGSLLLLHPLLFRFLLHCYLCCSVLLLLHHL